MIQAIIKRKLFWACATLLLFSIVASIYVNRAAFDFCVSGELAANWLCTYNTSPKLNVEYYTTPDVTQADVVTGTPSIQPSLPRPWNGKERVNILVMGIDQRQGEKEPAYRTDTMIVLTLDPITLEAGMLSIPRDLWVPIPGYDNGRINTANFIGDAYDYPGGGPALARKTVEQVLGIPINFYARVNFTAFEEFVDRIGGITVEVPEDIYDPEYPTEDYGTEVFSISKGVHDMDGATALKFARTRHNLTNGDFDRARNQQLVLLAVKDKLSTPQVLVSLLASAPELVSKLSASLTTDLTLDQVQQLATLAQKVDRKNVKSAVLDQEYTEFATTLTNPPQQVQVPIRTKIAELRETFFATTVNAAVETSVGATPSTETDTPVTATASGGDASATGTDTDIQWQSEHARLVLLNGTLAAGFAQEIADALSARGFNVVRVGSSPDDRLDYEHTLITDYGGKLQTLDALTEVLSVQSTAEVKRLLDPKAEADIVVVLGSDAKLP